MQQLDLFEQEENKVVESVEDIILFLENKVKKLEEEQFYIDNKAFEWEEEFPQCFNENEDLTGFDAIVGNPPYIRVYSENINPLLVEYYKEHYKTAHKKFDIYVLFMEKALQLLKKDGFAGFIIPDKWLSQPYGKKIRNLYLEEACLYSISDLTKLKVFSKAVVSNVIFNIKKSEKNNEFVSIRKFETEKEYTQKKLESVFLEVDKPYLIHNTSEIKSIVDKIDTNSIKLTEIAYVNWGCRPTPQAEFISNKKLDKRYKPLLVGSNISKYFISKNHRWVKYVKTMYNPLFKELFENETILFKDIIGKRNLTAALNTKNYYSDFTTINVLLWKTTKAIKNRKFKTPKNVDKYVHYSNKFILGIVNSKLVSFYFNKTMKNGLHTLPNNVKNLPIVYCLEHEQKPIIELVNKIIAINFNNKNKIKNMKIK